MIVTEADGSRKFQLAFDMRGFEPEEVKIKTQNGALTISAKKEKKVRWKTICFIRSIVNFSFLG